MLYVSHVPAPPLNAYIHDLYYLDGQSPYPRLKVSPDAMLHLMVNLGQPFEVYAPNQAIPFATCSESWWIGLWSQYWIVDWPQPVRFYGVHFKPAGVYPFLRLPLSELSNQVVPVDAIWGRFSAELREQLHAASTTCVCAAASISKTRIIRWRLAPCQLIDFLQVIRVTLLHVER